MSFSCTQTIGQYTAKDTEAAINEIRTKTDFLKDNRWYCGGNYTSNLSTHKAINNASDDTTYDSNVNTGVLTGNNTTHCTTNYPSDLQTYWGGRYQFNYVSANPCDGCGYNYQSAGCYYAWYTAAA